jgi:hypothetical protein
VIRSELVTVDLIGTPDVPLTYRGGRLILDAGQAPHVSGSIEIATPDADTLAALDPRLEPRIRVSVTVDGALMRTFDLGLRSRPRQVRAATITLTVASDEALLLDYAPLADDTTPRTLAASLRNIVDYVLGTAIPGAELAPTPAVDADMTPYWPLTNLIINPSVYNGTSGFLAGANVAEMDDTDNVPYVGETCLFWRAAAPGDTSIRTYSIGVTGGQAYRFTVYVRHDHGGTRDVRLSLRFVSNDQDLTPIGSVTGSPVAVPSGTWTRLTVAASAPPDARVMCYVIGDALAADNTFRADAFMFHEDIGTVEPYFQGSGIPAPSGYITEWSDTPNRSQSVRTPLVERDPASVVWRAGQTALDFLNPLVQAAGLRLVCDERRTWTLRPASYVADGTLQLREGVNVSDGGIDLSRDAEDWFDAAVVRHSWTTRDGINHERVESYALNEPHTRARLFEKDTPWPGPGFAKYAVERAQGRGREVTATAQTDWAANPEMTAALELHGEDAQLGTVQRVEFDLPGAVMTVTARSVDAVGGSWRAAKIQHGSQTWDAAALQWPTETWDQAAERTSGNG